MAKTSHQKDRKKKATSKTKLPTEQLAQHSIPGPSGAASSSHQPVSQAPPRGQSIHVSKSDRNSKNRSEAKKQKRFVARLIITLEGLIRERINQPLPPWRKPHCTDPIPHTQAARALGLLAEGVTIEDVRKLLEDS